MPNQESRSTRDHDEIRRWVEERGGVPATVEGTESGQEAGILRIDFPGRGEDAKLLRISWDEFFEKFDDAGLTFLYQDTTADGGVSRFSKFIRGDQSDSRSAPGRRSNSRSSKRSEGSPSSRRSAKNSGKGSGTSSSSTNRSGSSAGKDGGTEGGGRGRSGGGRKS